MISFYPNTNFSYFLIILCSLCFSTSFTPTSQLEASLPPPQEMSIGDKIKTHIKETIGPIEQVLSEIHSTDGLYIDIIWSKTTLQNGKKVNVLVTCGMSEKKMLVPKSKDAYERIELMIILPDTWEISPEAFKEENNYWPIRLLKYLARFPHRNKTWFDEGHTIESYSENGFYSENTKFVAAILADSKTFPNSVVPFKKNGIKIYLATPLYQEEVDFKLEKEYKNFKPLLQNSTIEVLDINRAPLI